jgi:anti-sigma factor ChrR (cupin superfamily)
MTLPSSRPLRGAEAVWLADGDGVLECVLERVAVGVTVGLVTAGADVGAGDEAGGVVAAMLRPAPLEHAATASVADTTSAAAAQRRRDRPAVRLTAAGYLPAPAASPRDAAGR